MKTKSVNAGWQFPKNLRGKIDIAYLFNDGIVLLEKKEVRVSKSLTTRVTIAHIWRHNFRVIVRDYSRDAYDKPIDMHPRFASAVISNPACLQDGLHTVEIGLHCVSIFMQEKGLDCTNVTFTTPTGACHIMNQFQFMHRDWQLTFENVADPMSDYNNMPTGKQSVNDFRKDGTIIISYL